MYMQIFKYCGRTRHILFSLAMWTQKIVHTLETPLFYTTASLIRTFTQPQSYSCGIVGSIVSSIFLWGSDRNGIYNVLCDNRSLYTYSRATKLHYIRTAAAKRIERHCLDARGHTFTYSEICSQGHENSFWRFRPLFHFFGFPVTTTSLLCIYDSGDISNLENQSANFAAFENLS